MDIDKQLGAITAEFWSQIGNSSAQNDILIPAVGGVKDVIDQPLSLMVASNIVNQQQELQQHRQLQTSSSNAADLLDVSNKNMELETDLVLADILPLHSNLIQENDLSLSNYQQTLGEIIEETLSKTNKNNTPPTKNSRSRKNSQRIQQNSSQAIGSSIGQLSQISNNGKDSNGRNQDNLSVCEWFDNQEKQQTMDREEKAIQRKRANNKNKKWTPQELQRLYDLLECFGTDFTTIQQYFDKKTVTQIKNKFHKEEKENPQRIKELLFCKGSNKRLSIKLENERDFQTIQQYYNDKYLHSNLNQIQGTFDSFSNSSTPLSLASPSSQENSISIKPSSQFNQQSLIQRIPACINLPSQSLKIVADDIERRLLKERSNTQ